MKRSFLCLSQTINRHAKASGRRTSRRRKPPRPVGSATGTRAKRWRRQRLWKRVRGGGALSDKTGHVRRVGLGDCVRPPTRPSTGSLMHACQQKYAKVRNSGVAKDSGSCRLPPAAAASCRHHTLLSSWEFPAGGIWASATASAAQARGWRGRAWCASSVWARCDPAASASLAPSQLTRLAPVASLLQC